MYLLSIHITREANAIQAVDKCWEQNDECWETAYPTGGQNCHIWEDKCHDMNDSCNNGAFTGPPDSGKDLTPPAPPLKGSTKVFKRGHQQFRRGHI